jgi:bifunctional non-homologous end joining protein LigD
MTASASLAATEHERTEQLGCNRDVIESGAYLRGRGGGAAGDCLGNCQGVAVISNGSNHRPPAAALQAWRAVDRIASGNLSVPAMSLRPHALPAGFIAPCLPTSAPQPPSGDGWLHEIKHDGFRVIARKEGKRVMLYSRPGNDLTHRFPLIVEALAELRSRSCIIDGEAVACGDDGVASFDRIRYRHHDADVFLYAFDLIELDGDDLRRDPLAVRKATLASLLARAAPGLRLNEHLDEEDGPLVFQHACKLGLEGIVSKRRNSPYRSGRSLDWIKSKNPNAPAVKREAEEDWGR